MDGDEINSGDVYADVIFLKVMKDDAEPIRRNLIENGFLRFDTTILTESDTVSFPVIKGISEEQLNFIQYPSATPVSISVKRVPLRPKKITNFRDMIDIPEEYHKFLPSSWDVVGEIILVKLSDEILPFKRKVAGALIDTHRSIRSVYRVITVSGNCRVRELEHIGGVENTETTAREFGVIMELDVTKVYYSPRLATERWRIAQQVEEGERILDMFAGIGPFSLVISRHARPATIQSIDINPEAIRYLERNIKLNRIENMKFHQGDAALISKKLSYKYKFDRIIMNLPHSSVDFLPGALACSKRNSTIHLYLIDEIDRIDDIVKDCISKAWALGYSIIEKGRVNVRSYSPVQTNVCIDISVDGIS